MSKWQYSPRVRIVPVDGPEVIYVLSAVGGGGTGAREIKLKYPREAVQRRNLARKLIKRDFGRRIAVSMTFDITEMTEEAIFIDIYNAACTDGTVVYLSLDGGVTEHEVVVPEDGGYEWEPLAKKNYIGIRVTLELVTAQVFDTIRPMLSPGGDTQWA